MEVPSCTTWLTTGSRLGAFQEAQGWRMLALLWLNSHQVDVLRVLYKLLHVIVCLQLLVFASSFWACIA